MKGSSRFLLRPCVLVAALMLVACGGDNPLGPSSTAGLGQGVTVRGTVLGSASSSSGSVRSLGASAGTLTVSVQGNPALSASVGADGVFTLRGLPEGSFTLVFTRDGTVIGTVTLDGVKPNQEIVITVVVTAAGVTVVDEQRNGIGHGDLEIEGTVDQVLLLNSGGESRFLIGGRTVVARPGQTAIREGNSSRGVTDVTVGRRVHVKATYLPPEGTLQPVLALEIKLQGPGDGNAGVSGCMINGGRVGDRIELEGDVVSGSAASFLLRVQGNRATNPVQVDAGAAGFECTPRSGPNAPTPAQCRASVAGGAKVHVSGTLRSCDATSALVAASSVRVQK